MSELTSPRPPTEALSTTAVVDAALAVVHRESLEALSMRKVARELGRAPMSLYRHVSDVEELRSLVAEALVGQVQVTDHGEDWRRTLAEAAHALRDVVGAHPGILAVLMRSGLTTPTLLRPLDTIMGALRRAGLDAVDVTRAESSIVALVFGSVILRRAVEEVFPPGSDITARQRLVDGLLDDDVALAHPNVAAVAPVWVAMHDDDPFDFALDRLLDGIHGRASSDGSAS